MRGFALGLSLSLAFIVGCLAGPHLTGTADAQVRGRYRYHCVEGSHREDRLNALLNRVAERGWRLVAVGAANDGAGSQWCFEAQ